ncbi:hypothetical protein HYALB_00012884 [Hymenoscyphus albidus]|uniref:Required for respiratory growth protein 7, mitochondrial n=1 Tax=Hymenoscyphus albidus TaxID=595503 RepID=A0A9N9LMR2_9HELO|nr:hypothetical protein HYALB_00012884 [Hymenoscyphus albidus]
MFCLLPPSRRILCLQQPQAFRNLSTTIRKLRNTSTSQLLLDSGKKKRTRKASLKGNSDHDGVQNVSTETSEKEVTLKSLDPTSLISSSDPSTKKKRKKKETLESPKLTSEKTRTKKDISKETEPDIPIPVKKPRRKKEKLVYPDSSSLNHLDLSTFLEYATRTGMSQTSTTYVGTHYEYIVQIACEQHLGMSLKRIGGKSDYGIDLLGTWKLPTAKRHFRVLVQCKALGAKVQPAVVRELEGAFVGAPPGWRDPDVLGFLVTQRPATKGVREALGRSRWPMGYVLCESDGSILQILWNRRAAEVGLDGVEVQTRYLGGEQTRREALLSWKGKPIRG